MEEFFRVILPVLAGLAAMVSKLIFDYLGTKQARNRVLEAEREAFKVLPEAFAAKTVELETSQERLEQRTQQLQELLDRAQSSLRVGVLLDLYNKQIEKYQTETQARAGWSFIFAILAMFAGLGFVIWGGTVVFSGGGWQKVAAGSAISAIGGAVSAYITKTFLDVHRLSLLQLNRYFRQPVLNAHILTAQRLADLLDETDAKREAYLSIINRVIALIREDAGDEGLMDRPTPQRTPRRWAAKDPLVEGEAPNNEMQRTRSAQANESRH